MVRSRHLMSPINSLLTYTGLPHRVMTVSSFVKKLMVSRGIDDARVGIVPPIAVPPQWSQIAKRDPWQCLQDTRADVRAELGFSDEQIVVGCVAVLREPKGHLELLKAMAPLCQANPRVQLVIVGDGQPVMDRLIALREQFGIAAQVHLLGYRQGACRLMAGFDIFALATHKEAAGTVFLEAAYVARGRRTGDGGGRQQCPARAAGRPGRADQRTAYPDRTARPPPADGPGGLGMDAQRAPLHPDRSH